jgi:hypothetical protein
MLIINRYIAHKILDYILLKIIQVHCHLCRKKTFCLILEHIECELNKRLILTLYNLLFQIYYICNSIFQLNKKLLYLFSK